MEIEYKLPVILVSVVIAVFSSGISLYMLNNLDELNKALRIRRMLAAAVVFATGAWSMNFIGMLACIMPVPVAYDKLITFYSYLAAVLGVFPVMLMLGRSRLTLPGYFGAALLLSVAISIMHYTGMASLQMSTPIVYDRLLLLLSVMAAFFASLVGIYIIEQWKSALLKPRYLLVTAAVVLGCAVSSMHYIAMRAAHFAPDSISLAALHGGLSGEHLLHAIIAVTLLIVLLPLFSVLKSKRPSVWKILLIIVLAEMSIMLVLPLVLPANISLFWQAICDVGLLVLFVSPIAWQLKRTSDALLASYQMVERNLEVQEVNNKLLKAAIHELELSELLHYFLEVIFALSWLKVMPKGVIFLKSQNDELLRMAAQYNIAQQIQLRCQQVKYGQCLCGKAAMNKEMEYHQHVGKEHTTIYPGMDDHGHFILPLTAENEMLGVLCLYLQPGQHLSEFQQGSISCLVATISELIHLKQALDELALANTVFDHSFDCLMITDAAHKILNVNPKFTQVTGYKLEEVLGKTPALLASKRKDKRNYAMIEQQIQKNGQWQGEVWNSRKNGEEYPQWLSICSVKDSRGKILYYVSTFEDISHKKEAEAKMHKMAFYDELTGLPNRRLFYETLKQAVKHAKRSGDKIALLFIDLDRFKEVNDTLGHQAGDQLLITVTQRIRECLRESDMLARLGGDEFVVILEDLKEGGFLSQAMVCQKIAEKILYKLSLAHYFDEYVIYGGASIGIVFYPDNAADFNQLLQRADTAMYQAKSAGRNTYCFFSEDMSVDIKKRVTMIQELKNALQNNEFSLLYQPQISMEHQQVVGAEALIRWHNPVLGQVSPLDFIPLVEEIGLIYEIGLWVMRQVCRQVKQWDDSSEMNLEYVALNVSIHQLIHPEFVDDAISICRMEGIDSQRIEMEITEGGLAKYPDNITEILHKLREAGFRLAIDDFGTDYSSLSRLKHFNVDLLKIDRSFVMNMTHDANDAAIAQAVVDLAKALGLLTLAEGVETIEQFDALKAMGCERCQGYYFGKPMLPESLVELFKQRNKSVTSDPIKQEESIED